MSATFTIPSSLDAFAAAVAPLAAVQDHEGVSQLLRELISEPGFADTVPAFAPVDPSPNGWRLGGEHIVCQSEALTVMVLDTLPGVLQPPHDHEMRAIIGVFAGCEDQRFFGRTSRGITPTATRRLRAGDVMVLGRRAIHAISSPDENAARAIHVYFGDIYDVDRTLFHPDTLEPHPYTGDRYDDFCRAGW